MVQPRCATKTTRARTCYRSLGGGGHRRPSAEATGIHPLPPPSSTSLVENKKEFSNFFSVIDTIYKVNNQ
jgi:hypothetical protein